MNYALQSDDSKAVIGYLLSDIRYSAVNPSQIKAFPVKGPLFPLFESLSKKGLHMKDPKSGLRPPASFPFVPESQGRLVKDGQTRAERLADAEAENFLNHLQPFEVGLRQSDCGFLDYLLQFLGPSRIQSQTPCPQSHNASFGWQTEVTSPSEIDHSESAELGLNVASLSLGWILGPKSASFTDRILARLIQAEAHEGNPHLKADYRQAEICLILAARGNTEPFVVSSYQMYGCHPDKVFGKVMAIRRAKLGKEFSDWYDEAGNLKPELPKKESASAPSPEPHIALATSGDDGSRPPKKPSESITRNEREEQA